jgi:predicted sulfurtransferase
MSNNRNQIGGGKKRKSLGSWFPSASVIKSATYTEDTPISLCLFYQYVKPLWTESQKIAAIKYIEDNAELLNVGGRVRVGLEGLNATISSSKENIRKFTAKLGEFDPHFKSTDFKYIDDLSLDRAFKDLKVLPVKELVYYGIHAEKEFAEGGKILFYTV